MAKIKRVICIMALAIFSFILLVSSASALIMTSPEPHSTWNAFPFGPWYSNEIPNRYQQIWDASLFSGPINIEALAFSPLYTGNYSADITIRLTQTSTAVNALSSPLDSNVTGSLTTVFSDSSYAQSITVTGPDSFSFAFDFSSTPFFYDPTGGENLLMDVLINNIIYDNLTFGPFSAAYTSTTNRVFEFPSGQISGGTATLRTQFTFTEASAVPEPSTVFLLGSGLFAISIFRNKFGK